MAEVELPPASERSFRPAPAMTGTPMRKLKWRQRDA
jgi:hypothetical protein